MKCNVYEECLKKALENARYLKSKGFDWSGVHLIDYVHILRDTSNYVCDSEHRDLYIKAYIECYDSYKNTIWACVYSNLLMGYIMDTLTDTNNQISILDVGCGTCMHFRSMCKGIDSKNISKYTTIDKKSSKELHSKLYDEHPTIFHTHMQIDILDENISSLLDEALHHDTYDIVVLDIEPHGNEIKIYERIYPYLKQEHIVICKCIGFIDLYGPSMANDFLSNVQEANILHTYFGVCELSGYLTRDVVAIINKKGCNYKGIINKKEIDKYIYYDYERDKHIPTTMSKYFVDYMLCKNI